MADDRYFTMLQAVVIETQTHDAGHATVVLRLADGTLASARMRDTSLVVGERLSLRAKREAFDDARNPGEPVLAATRATHPHPFSPKMTGELRQNLPATLEDVDVKHLWSVMRLTPPVMTSRLTGFPNFAERGRALDAGHSGSLLILPASSHDRQCRRSRLGRL